MENIPPDLMRESIGLLDEDWFFYQTTGLCPKCKSQMLGTTLVYDEACDKVNMITCTICGKNVYPEGGQHLEGTLEMRSSDGTYGPHERGSS
mgnify:CR=1 FL=1